MYKTLWSSNVPSKHAKVVFRAILMSLLLNGLTPFILTEANVKRLRAAYYQMLRKLAKRGACIKSEVICSGGKLAKRGACIKSEVICSVESSAYRQPASVRYKSFSNQEVCKITGQITIHALNTSPSEKVILGCSNITMIS